MSQWCMYQEVHLNTHHLPDSSFQAMDYDEACFMHLTPGVFHNFPKAVGV